jgi:hypothetical protein
MKLVKREQSPLQVRARHDQREPFMSLLRTEMKARHLNFAFGLFLINYDLEVP